ncbi:MAG: RNA 2',3'-cyclic phosphodiesterase [Acidobacteriota bacterium]
MPDIADRAAALTVRAFVAVPRDPLWSESARQFVETVRPTCPDSAWTRPSAWHLTLKFLGDAPADSLETFALRFAPAAAAVPAGALRPGGPIVFPPRGPARVLGLGFARTRTLEDLEALAGAAETLARGLGLQREDRAFHPHATLARVRAPWPREAVDRFRRKAAEWTFPDFAVSACVLYGSRLAPGGAVHTPVAEWLFARDGAGAGAGPLP